MMNLFRKLMVALVLLVPSAFLFTLGSYWIISSATSAIAGSDLTYRSDIPTFPLFLVSWAAPLLWVMVTDSIKRTVVRTCWVFSMAGFAIPAAGLVATLLAYFYTSSLGSLWGAVFIQVMVGFPLGTIGLALALNMSPGEV